MSASRYPLGQPHLPPLRIEVLWKNFNERIIDTADYTVRYESRQLEINSARGERIVGVQDINTILARLAQAVSTLLAPPVCGITMKYSIFQNLGKRCHGPSFHFSRTEK